MAKEKDNTEEPVAGSPPPVPANRMIAKGQVRVRVIGSRPLSEEGIRQPGDIFQTSVERAAALSHSVEIVK